jgi:hypothetical protein
MLAILHALGMLVADLFKSRRRLEAENLLLRHQLNIALRRAPPRLRLLGSDRALLTWMMRLWPSLLDAVQVVQPETILRWHRAGFTLRRECLDQVVIFSEMHLRRVLSAYASYYNQARTHLALQKDAPLHRAVQRSGAILTIPILAGLHHQYGRI